MLRARLDSIAPLSRALRGAALAALAVWGLGGAIGQGAAAGVPLEALLESAIMAEVEADLPPNARLQFVLPEGSPPEGDQLIALEHDLRRNAFGAVVQAGYDKITLRGRVFAVIDLPVPRRAIPPGEIATAEDFEMRTMPVSVFGANTVSNLAGIDGQEVRRLLPEGRPVQGQSLQAPRVVKRGERLTVVYDRGALAVTAPAKALDNAALGEVVRVQNLNSNKVLTGIAMGDGRVQVSP